MTPASTSRNGGHVEVQLLALIWKKCRNPYFLREIHCLTFVHEIFRISGGGTNTVINDSICSATLLVLKHFVEKFKRQGLANIFFNTATDQVAMLLLKK